MVLMCLVDHRPPVSMSRCRVRHWCLLLNKKGKKAGPGQLDPALELVVEELPCAATLADADLNLIESSSRWTGHSPDLLVCGVAKLVLSVTCQDGAKSSIRMGPNRLLLP